MSKAKPWFIKVRGSYLPNSWQGWLTYIPYSAYVAGVGAYAITRSTDIWSAIFVIIPNLVAAAVIMTWLAAQKS